MQNLEKGRLMKAEDLIPMKAGHTISKAVSSQFVLFSLAADTDISPETFIEDKSFYVFKGDACITGQKLSTGDMITVQRGTPLGIHTEGGAYLLEGTWEGEKDMNLEKGKVLKLKDQIEYVDGAISNVDLAKREGVKFALLAFDEGQGLTPHTAPGDALIIALEGKARVTMGDVEAVLEEGNQFVFEKGKLHSVQALTKFKMGILLVIE